MKRLLLLSCLLFSTVAHADMPHWVNEWKSAKAAMNYNQLEIAKSKYIKLIAYVQSIEPQSKILISLYHELGAIYSALGDQDAYKACLYQALEYAQLHTPETVEIQRALQSIGEKVAVKDPVDTNIRINFDGATISPHLHDDEFTAEDIENMREAMRSTPLQGYEIDAVGPHHILVSPVEEDDTCESCELDSEECKKK